MHLLYEYSPNVFLKSSLDHWNKPSDARLLRLESVVLLAATLAIGVDGEEHSLLEGEREAPEKRPSE